MPAARPWTSSTSSSRAPSIAPGSCLEGAFLKLGRSLLAALLLATLFVAASAALGAPGDLDPGFGTGGVADIRIGASDDRATALVQRADGRLVAIGRAGDDAALARYMPDGTLDPSFGVGGRAVLRMPDSNASPLAAAEQPDGKIVVLASSGFAARPVVLRVNTDGSLDPSFDRAAATYPANAFAVGTRGVAIQADGKILVTLQVGFAGGSFGVARLLPTGALDASFGAAGFALVNPGSEPIPAGVVVAPDGSFTVAATLFVGTAEPQVTAVRFLPGGARDPSFTMEGVPGSVRSLALQPDGKLVLVGCAAPQSGQQLGAAWRRLANGDPDPAFGTAGRATLDFDHCMADVAVRPDGRIAATTISPNEMPNPNDVSYIALLEPNGSRSFGFGSGGLTWFSVRSTHHDVARAIAVLPDGRIVAGGNTSPRDFALRRVTASGQSDSSFGSPQALPGTVSTEFLNGRSGTLVGMRHVNGKFVLLAALDYLSPPPGISPTPVEAPAGIARILSDGTMDISFGGLGQTLLGQFASVSALAVLPDDRILVAGTANNFGGPPTPTLRRFNADATPDATFVSPIHNHGHVTSLELQPDGKILVAGHGAQLADLFFGRLEPNGAPDAAFGVNGFVRRAKPYPGWTGTTRIALQPDGRILIGDVSETPFSVLRVSSNGSVDADFGPAGSNGVVTLPNPDQWPGTDTALGSIAVHADGRVTLAGSEEGSYQPCSGVFGNRAATGRVGANGLPGAEVAGAGYLSGPLKPLLFPAIQRARLDGADRLIAAGTRHVDCLESIGLGSWSRTGAVAMRFTPSGALDNRFGDAGVVTLEATKGWWSTVADPAIDASGRIVIPVATRTGLSGRFALYALQGGGDSAPVGNNADIDADGLPNTLERAERLDPFVRDNDVFSSARLYVMQQYRDFLGRESDASGVTSWTNFMAGSGDRASVADSFLRSAEFQGRVAPMTRLYFAYFLRIPDYDGLNYWISQFASGNSLEAISNQFAVSPEFVNTYGALDNAGFVDRVYRNVLGRAPDAGGLAHWTGQLQGGMTRGQLMVQFSESAEYRALIANEVYVTMVYAGMLRRAPDAGGFAHWVIYLDAGSSAAALVGGFVASIEYRARFLP